MWYIRIYGGVIGYWYWVSDVNQNIYVLAVNSSPIIFA